ncbi:MAG: S46 family peptidase [Haliscomenobacter sp.]|nr:S46 family peptidase [Haliscomenobacter sp.]
MKRIGYVLLMVLLWARSYADEGMWLPMLLGDQVYKEMVKKGLKLKPEQLYSMNKASIKDAIIIFGGGCTGEIVSDQGLIFTNHHCGYGAIAGASTMEHNYLRDGFWAADKSKEISSRGLSVQFLNKIEDVTARVEEAIGSATGMDKNRKLSEVFQKIAAEATGGDEFKRASVNPIFRGRQYLLYVYDVYKDVRLVGTPPESVGKFGGDTDNWEWPRHTGDFSVFRVYMSPDGKPANHNASNVPYKPKHFLPVSIKGFADGDYAMIFGYPGGTNRYETSYGVNLSTDINNPTLVKLRDMRLRYMFEEMKKDPAVKLQLASEYAGVANYWKFFDGETKQLLKYDIAGQKKRTEDAFTAWAKGKPKYENVMGDFAKIYEAWRPYAMHRQYIQEGITGCRLIQASAGLLQLESLLMREDNPADQIKRAMDGLENARQRYQTNYNLKAEQKILANVLLMFLNDIDPAQHPEGFYSKLFRNYGSLDNSPFTAIAEDVFQNSIMVNDENWEAFKAKPTLDALKKDPAFGIADAFLKNFQNMVLPKYNEFASKNEELHRAYMDGLFEMNPDKMKATYPDANFTMRVSYGSVQSYKPKDAVTYDFVTTLSGVVSKYKPGDYEFDLPQKLLDLHKAKDFGRYADLKYNDIIVGFITNNDITGGNSGSPVINAKGELIGLAFDGNYEALSHKMAFDKDMIRTINVDIRYVLWCIEKLGGAKHIVDELKIAQ